MQMTSNRDINLFLEKLSSLVEGEILTDPYNLGIYSTDASIYQIKPMAIALPKSDSDLYSIVRTAREFQVPILARGAATSLAGQTVGNALVVDFSKYLDKILEINAPERSQSIWTSICARSGYIKSCKSWWYDRKQLFRNKKHCLRENE
jgi:hypothetical protein